MEVALRCRVLTGEQVTGAGMSELLPGDPARETAAQVKVSDAASSPEVARVSWQRRALPERRRSSASGPQVSSPTF